MPQSGTYSISLKVDSNNSGVDVKLIVHKREKDGGWLEKLRDIPFDTSVIRLQDGVHNKGIVVDSKIAVVGSHNWSSNGTIDNRDASLIFFHTGIAKYFEKIFLHDWTRLASPDGGATPRMRIANPGEATPSGFRRMKLKDLVN